MDISLLIVLILFLIDTILPGLSFDLFLSMNSNLIMFVVVVHSNPEAKRLYEELIKVRSYNKLIRPVKNNSEKLTVYLGLRLTQLLDVVSVIFLLIKRT